MGLGKFKDLIYALAVRVFFEVKGVVLTTLALSSIFIALTNSPQEEKKEKKQVFNDTKELTLNEFTLDEDENISSTKTRAPASIPDSQNEIENEQDRTGLSKKAKAENFFRGGSASGAQMANSPSLASNSPTNYQSGGSSNSSSPPPSSNTTTENTQAKTDTKKTESSATSTGDVEVGSIPSSSQTGASTDSFDNVTNSSSGNTTTTTSNPAISCSVNKSEGTYNSSFSVELSCSEPVVIKYCLHIGDGTCDPQTSPTTYSSAINLNAGDNIYSLSYFAESIATGETTSIKNLNYIIDSNPPGLIVNFPMINVQSTELPFSNHTQSTDFGKTNHYYYQINFKRHNPTSAGLNWSCSEMLLNHGVLAAPAPIIIQNSYDISSLLSSDQIDQSIDGARLEAGDNYIATIIENKTSGLYSCQVQNVTISDFFISSFTASGSTNVAAGVRTTSGGFIGLGHYQATPNTNTSGASENTQSSTSNKSNFFSIAF